MSVFLMKGHCNLIYIVYTEKPLNLENSRLLQLCMYESHTPTVFLQLVSSKIIALSQFTQIKFMYPLRQQLAVTKTVSMSTVRYPIATLQ